MLARLSLALLLAAPSLAAGGPAPSDEYRIKAAYLYNFTKFVEWPGSAFAADQAPFVIAVLDRDQATADAIAGVLRGKRTNSGRPIEIVTATDYPAVPAHCQLLFVARSVPVDWSRIHERIDDGPVLVVGESTGFAQHGGAINFVRSGDSVRFEINPNRAAVAGLKVSGSLASVARLVRD